MSDEPDNIVLVHLRRIESKLDKQTEDIGDLKRRVTSLEAGVSLLHGDFAGQSIRIDRIEQRLERIGRRLDLVEG